MELLGSKRSCLTILVPAVLMLVQLWGCSQGRSIVLFDGSSLQGWEGKPEFFRVEAGSIVAGTLKKDIPRNEFLCTHEIFGDFELKVKARIQGEGRNAGIQFRSKRVPDNHEVSGYQCDMGSSPTEAIWGYLYDESRRNRFLAQPDQEMLRKALKPDDWNEFVIRAEGPRIQIWLNGIQTVDYYEEEPAIATTGVVCLQIHSGKPAEAWYKDIEITKF